MQIGILGPFEVRADDGTLADVPGDTGGTIVRIDTGQDQTVITVALPEGREPRADSPLGAGVEISEEDLLRVEG